MHPKRGREGPDDDGVVHYADDIKPLIITRHTSEKDHRRVVARVDNILEEEAARDLLKWDAGTICDSRHPHQPQTKLPAP